MTGLVVSAGAARGAGGRGRSPASPPGDDAGLCDQLRAYLKCRSRSVDPPPLLAEAWDRFYDLYAPRIRGYLNRLGLPDADRDDCLQDVWRRRGRPSGGSPL